VSTCSANNKRKTTDIKKSSHPILLNRSSISLRSSPQDRLSWDRVSFSTSRRSAKVGKKKDRRSMDRRIIEKDGKWRNAHGIDIERTIFDGKSFFVDTRIRRLFTKKKDKYLWSSLEQSRGDFLFKTLSSSFLFEYNKDFIFYYLFKI